MSTPQIQERLQQLVDRQAASKHIRSVVVGVQSADGRIDAVSAAGDAHANSPDLMTPDTPYFLASITKMYTATVVMKLAGSGEVDLDAPISTYLAADLLSGVHVVEGTDYSDQITVSQLVGQTSGLADYFEGKPDGGASLVDDLKRGRDRSLDIDGVVAIVRRLSPEFAPGAGKKAFYSDTNYALLGAIIETVTHDTVADNFQQMIFAPLGLANTYVFGSASEQPRPAALYFKDRVVDIPLAMSSFAPDGGVVSTVSESLRFLQAFFGGELLTSDQLELMTSRWNRIFFPLRYGYGLMRFQVPRWMSPFQAPPELIGHSGSTGSFAFHNPKRDLYVAGTVNQMDRPNRPFRLMTQVMGLVD
ncbi:MAG: serine hydrolase domain-containing protein [Acidimicrobiia bacterium]|nr:serine hydrolase domain-containing protein [Acidimicrobiia bacterium]